MYLKINMTGWAQNYVICKELHRNNSYISWSHCSHLLCFKPCCSERLGSWDPEGFPMSNSTSTTVFFHTKLFQKPNFYCKQFKFSLELSQLSTLAIETKKIYCDRKWEQKHITSQLHSDTSWRICWRIAILPVRIPPMTPIGNPKSNFCNVIPNNCSCLFIPCSVSGCTVTTVALHPNNYDLQSLNLQSIGSDQQVILKNVIRAIPPEQRN